jgi:hypothetical protein
MALRPDRNYNDGVQIAYFMSEVATRGIIVTHSSSASGAGMDDANGVVKIPTGTGDGNPAGLLLHDVVNKDLTQSHLNEHKDEVQLGSKVAVLARGWVVSNMIKTGETPAAGGAAYFDADGELSATGGSPRIGTWLGAKDADGFAKLAVTVE